MELNQQKAEQLTILKVLVGSRIHGLHLEDSDYDHEAICIEPLSNALGLGAPFEELIIKASEGDLKYVSLRKWCRLALKGNPNFLLPLFAPVDRVIYWNAVGSQLREMREMFLSKHVITAHLGYLRGQRTRLLAAESNDGRGKPRQDLTDQFGYDTKFAMHLLRVGYQGGEFATKGSITLPIQEDYRRFLMGVRQGKYTLAEVLECAELQEALIKVALTTSSLPDEPNYEAVEQWMLRVYLRTWSATRSYQDWLEDSLHGGLL